MQLSRGFLCSIVIICASGCATDSDSLSQNLPCETSADCAEGQSCRVDTCIEDGTLTEGSPCSESSQCDVGYTCYGFTCVPGCADVYHASDCNAPTWCKPLNHGFSTDDAGLRSMVGECVESECDPDGADTCSSGQTCVKVSEALGACVDACEYGFVGETYSDTCEAQDGVAHACTPLGQNYDPVCLPEGAATGPNTNEPGCDTVRNPCQPGAICINVVCRQLCHDGQSQPCPGGQSCMELADRNDISYCKAD